ncbi:MAG: 4-hydroxy-tetrahydrodipicolinate reductase [Bradymonadia bacterium]
MTAETAAAPIHLGLFGAGGRMGRAVISLVPEFPTLTLSTTVGHRTDPEIDFAGCDVVIDFALAQATDDLLKRLDGSRAALITGVTGRTQAQEDAIRVRQHVAPVLEASNFSVGVAILRRLAAQAAKMTGTDWDLEVMEIHHRRKQDAPSGTALTLATDLAEARGQPWPQSGAMGRAATGGSRSAGEIGVSAVRGGDVVGDHTIYFMGPMERLELTHRAIDRRVFAHGALLCARWAARQGPGLYTIYDVLDDAI